MATGASLPLTKITERARWLLPLGLSQGLSKKDEAHDHSDDNTDHGRDRDQQIKRRPLVPPASDHSAETPALLLNLGHAQRVPRRRR